MTEEKWQKILNEVEVSTSRSSGPGGQHTNRTESRVEVRWNFAVSSLLSEQQKQRIKNQLKRHIIKEEILQLFHDHQRSQHRNKAAALNRLRFILEQALRRQKQRKATQPSKASIEKRLNAKRQRSEKKLSRQKIRY